MAAQEHRRGLLYTVAPPTHVVLGCEVSVDEPKQSSTAVALHVLARIFEVNVTYSCCNGHSGVQSTQIDVSQG